MSDATYFRQGKGSLNNIAVATQVLVVSPDQAKGQARLVRVNVTTAGAVGAAYDATNATGAVAANLIAIIPAVVGPILFDVPLLNGLYVVPGAAQVCNVTYD